MIGKFMLLDAAFAFYFLFVFRTLHPGWTFAGYLVGLLLVFRIVKDILPDADKRFEIEEEEAKTVQEKDGPLDRPPPPV